jgi:hypothetical protein
MANTMTLIATQTLSSTSATVTFTSIPQTYTDLKLVTSARCYRGTADHQEDLDITFNGSTTGYYRKDLGYSPARSTSGSNEAAGLRNGTPSDAATANTFNNAEYYIPNYTSSNYKSFSMDTVSEDNATYALLWIYAGQWQNTAAITSITLKPDQSTYIYNNSTFSLYGIKNS